MIWVDYAILGILAISAIISLMRGFMREAVSLLGWVLAFWVAFAFSDGLAALLEDQITIPTVRYFLAFFTLFLGVLVLTAMAQFMINLLVEKTAITGTDRMLGMFFGIARGMVIISMLVLGAGATPLPADSWWGKSILIPHFQRLAVELQTLLPADLATRIKF